MNFSLCSPYVFFIISGNVNKQVREETGQLLTKELKGRPPFEADDQSAMVYLLASQRHRWGNKVYFENSYCLHGYWDFLVDKYVFLISTYSYHSQYSPDLQEIGSVST